MGLDHSGHTEVEDMPAIADEAGTKLFNLLEMFGRELIRNELHKNAQLREEADRAKKTARDLSNAGQGLYDKAKKVARDPSNAGHALFGNGAGSSQPYTQTWFKSPEGAQATLRELKQLSPKLFASSTVVGHFIIHPKSKVISNAIEDISRDHRLVAYAMDLDALDRDKSKSAYLKSQPDGNYTRFSFGEFGDEGASFNAAYYCSVLQDYDISARHIGNQVILDYADTNKALEALDIERKKVEAMGPERGEMFMRQRFMDRIGVEYEPPLIGGEAEGYENADGDLSVEASAVDTDAEDRESGEAGFYVPSLDDVDEARDGCGIGNSTSDGKTGPESTEEIAEEELAEKTVESSPAVRSDGELSAGDADEMLSRETRKAELHEDISNSKTTADCVQARPDTHNGDLSTPYADGQDAPGTGDSDGDGIRDAAEDRDGDGVPDKHDRDAEYIDDDPDYEPVSMKERTVDELMSDKTEEAAFVASRSAAQAEKDVSLETVNR